MYLNITLGYEMTRNEVEKYLSDNGFSWEDYSSEEEAYIEAAEEKFNYGLGCSASKTV